MILYYSCWYFFLKSLTHKKINRIRIFLTWNWQLIWDWSEIKQKNIIHMYDVTIIGVTGMVAKMLQKSKLLLLFNIHVIWSFIFVIHFLLYIIYLYIIYLYIIYYIIYIIYVIYYTFFVIFWYIFFMLYVFVIYLCYMFYYIFIIYLYVYYMYFKFVMHFYFHIILF